MESAILTPKRTEYGKAIRKAYESGAVKESRHNMTELEPRTDGISNTLTTVQKDNLLLEVKQVGNLTENAKRDNPSRRRVYDSNGLSPTLQSCMGEGGNLQPFIVEEQKEKRLGNIYGFDGGNYAGNVYDDEMIAPTIRTFQGGNQQPMIVAVRGRNPDNPSDRTAESPTEQRLEPNSQGICNTLTSAQKDNLVMEKGSFCIGGLQEHQTARTDGISPSLTAVMGMGGGQTPLIPDSQYRIRKLTPLECWRLMGFSDEDFHKAEEVNSNSQLYKQAGNSIVKNVLIAIFGQMMPGKENYYKNLRKESEETNHE